MLQAISHSQPDNIYNLAGQSSVFLSFKLPAETLESSATGESNSLEDFVAAAFSEGGLDWRQYVCQDPKLFRPAEIRYSRGHAEKARRMLGWEPICECDR